MIHTPNSQLLVGLPGSGKTTFLAALWYYLRHNRDAGGLAVSKLPSERSYLNHISDRWVRGEKQIHTTTTRGSIEQVILELKNRDTNEYTALSVPDLSGELYLQGCANREWDVDFHLLAANANGVILFIHPDAVGRAATIADVASLTAALRDEPGEATTSHFDPSKSKSFDISSISAEVILVDQLQCLIGEPCGHVHLSVAIVISAWDEISAEGKTPQSWLRSHATFLSQFLESNCNRLTIEVFGISAQGCDYDLEQQRVSLLREKNNPIDRIDILTEHGHTHDITAPIKWLMKTEHDRKESSS